MHLLAPGPPPSGADLEKMTRIYQERVQSSPIWKTMVQRFGEEEAERLLREFRIEDRPVGS